MNSVYTRGRRQLRVRRDVVVVALVVLADVVLAPARTRRLVARRAAGRAVTRLSMASSSDGDVSIHAVCDVR